MSRVANAPVKVPKGVDVSMADGLLSVKGTKGQLQHAVHEWVGVTIADGEVRFAPTKQGDQRAVALLRRREAHLAVAQPRAP